MPSGCFTLHSDAYSDIHKLFVRLHNEPAPGERINAGQSFIFEPNSHYKLKLVYEKPPIEEKKNRRELNTHFASLFFRFSPGSDLTFSEPCLIAFVVEYNWDIHLW